MFRFSVHTNTSSSAGYEVIETYVPKRKASTGNWTK